MEDQRVLKKNRIPVKAVKKQKVLDFASRLRSSSRENTDQLKDSLGQLPHGFQTENGLLKRPIHHITGKENVNLKSKEPGNKVESFKPLASAKENQKSGQKTGLSGFLKTKLFKRNVQQVVDSEDKPTNCFQENPPDSPRSRKDLHILSLATKAIPSPKTIKKAEVTITCQPLTNQLGVQHNNSTGQNPIQSTATIDEGPIIRKAIPVAQQAELEPSPVIQKKESTTKPGIPRILAKPTSGPNKPQDSSGLSVNQRQIVQRGTIASKSFGYKAQHQKGKSTDSKQISRIDAVKVDSKQTVSIVNKFGFNTGEKDSSQNSNGDYHSSNGKTHTNNAPVVPLNLKCTETTCSEISGNDKTPPQSADKLTFSELSNRENSDGGNTRCQVLSNVIRLTKSNSFNIGYISSTCNNSDQQPSLNSSQNQQNSEKQSNLKKCVSFSNVEIGSYHSNPHLDSDFEQVKGILKKSLDSVCSKDTNNEPPVRTILKKSSSFTQGQKHKPTKDSGLRKAVSFNLGNNTHHIFTKDGDIERTEDKTVITSQKKQNRLESQDIRESPEIVEPPSETNVLQTRHDIFMAGHSQYGNTNITPSSGLKINYVGLLDNHLYEYSSSSSDQDSLDEVDFLPLKQEGVRYAGTQSHSLDVSTQSEKTDTGENLENSLNTVNNEKPVFSKKSYVEAGEGLQGFLKKRSKKSSTCALRDGATQKSKCVGEQPCDPKDLSGPKIIYYPKMDTTDKTSSPGKDSKSPRRVSPTKRNGSPCKDAPSNANKIPANANKPVQSRLPCKGKAKQLGTSNGSNNSTKGVGRSPRDVEPKTDPCSVNTHRNTRCGIPKSTKSSSPTPKMSSSNPKSSHRCLIPKINQQDPFMDYDSKTPEGQNDKNLSDSESKHHKSHSSLITDTSPCKIGKQGLGLITTPLSNSHGHGNSDMGQVTSFQAPELLVKNTPIKTDNRKLPRNCGDIDGLTTSTPDCQSFITSSTPDLKEVGHVVNIQDRNDTQKSKVNPSRRRIPTGIPSRVTPQKPLVADDKILQTSYNTCVGGTRGISDNKKIRDNQLREHFGGDKKCVSEPSSVIVFNNGDDVLKGVRRGKNVNFREQLSPLCNIVPGNNDIERERNSVVENVPEQTNLDFSNDSIEFDITRENREGLVADEHSVIDKYSNSRESDIKTGHSVPDGVKIVKHNESNISSSGVIISNQTTSSRASDILVPNQEFSHSKTSASSDPRSKSKSKIAKPINRASLKSVLINTNAVSKIPTKSNPSVQGHDIRAKINEGNRNDGTCVNQNPDNMERKFKGTQATKERMPSRESKNDKCEATDTSANQLQTTKFTKKTNEHGASSKNLLMTSKISRNGGIKTEEGIVDEKLNCNQLSGESLETKTKPANCKITVNEQTAITTSGTKRESTDIGNMTLIARASQNDDVTTIPGAFSNGYDDNNLKVEGKHPKNITRQTKDRQKEEGRNEKVDQTKKQEKKEIKDEISTESINKSTLKKAKSVETENVKERSKKKVKTSNRKCSESAETLRVYNKSKGTKLPKRQIAKSVSEATEKNCDVIKDSNISSNENNISVESSSSLNLHVQCEKGEIVVKSVKNKHLVEKEVVFSEDCESIRDVVACNINHTIYSSASKTCSEIDVLKVDYVSVSPSRIPIKKGSRSRENSESPNRTRQGHLSQSYVCDDIQTKLTSPCKVNKIQSKTNSDYFGDKNNECSLRQKIKSKPTKSDLCDNQDFKKEELYLVQSNKHRCFTQSPSMSNNNNKREVFSNKFMNNEENIEIVSSDLHVNKDKDINRDIDKKGLRYKEGFDIESEGKTERNKTGRVYEMIKETSPVEIEKEELTKSQLGLLTFSTELSKTDSESKIEQSLSRKHNSLEDNSGVLNRSSSVSSSDENNHSDKFQYCDKKYVNTSERVNLNLENETIKNREACVEDYERNYKTRHQDNSKNVNTVKSKSKTKHKLCDTKYSENLKTKSEKISGDFDSNLDDDSVLVCDNGVMKLVDKTGGILKPGLAVEEGLHSDNRVADHHMGVNNVSNSKGNKHGLVDQLAGNSDQRKMANDNRNQAFTSGGLQSTQGISGDHSTNKITSLKGQISNIETNTQMIDRTREKTLQEQTAGLELKKADDSFNGLQGNYDLIEVLSPRGHQGEIQSSDNGAESFNNNTADKEDGTTIAEKKKKKSTQKSTECSPKSSKRWDSSPTHVRRSATSPRHARKSETSPKHTRKEQQVLKKSVSVDERGHEELTLMTKLERLSRGLPIYDKKSPEIQRRAKSASPDMADKRRKLISPSRQPLSPKEQRQPKRPSDMQILPECPKDSKTSPKRSPTKTPHPESPTRRTTNSNPSSPKGNKRTPLEQTKTKKISNLSPNSNGSRIPMTKKSNNPEKIKSVTICETRSSSQCSTRESSVEDDRISKMSEASLRSEISSKLSSWTNSGKMDGTKPKSSSSRTSTRENSVEDDRLSTNSDTSFPSFSSTSKSSRTESKSSRQIPVSKSKETKSVKTPEDSFTPSSTRESSVESQLSFASDISSISSVSTSCKSSKSIPHLGKSVPTTSTPNKKSTEKKVACKTSVKQNGAKKPKSTRMPTRSERESSIESQVSDISQISSVSTSRLPTKPGVKGIKGSSKPASNTKTKVDVKRTEANSTRESSVESQASDVSHVSSVSTSRLPTRPRTTGVAVSGKTTSKTVKSTKVTLKTKAAKSEERNLRESSVDSQASDVSHISSVSTSCLPARHGNLKTIATKSRTSVKSEETFTRESSVESQASDISHISSASSSRLPTRPGTKTAKTTGKSASSQVTTSTGKSSIKSTTAAREATSKNGATKTLPTKLKTASTESNKTTSQVRSKIAVAATKVIAAKKFESNLKASREKKKTTVNQKPQPKTKTDTMGNQPDSLKKSDSDSDAVVIFNSHSEQISIIKPDNSTDNCDNSSESSKNVSDIGKVMSKGDALKTDYDNVTPKGDVTSKSDALKSRNGNVTPKGDVLKSDNGNLTSKTDALNINVMSIKEKVIKSDISKTTLSNRSSSMSNSSMTSNSRSNNDITSSSVTKCNYSQKPDNKSSILNQNYHGHEITDTGLNENMIGQRNENNQSGPYLNSDRNVKTDRENLSKNKTQIKMGQSLCNSEPLDNSLKDSAECLLENSENVEKTVEKSKVKIAALKKSKVGTSGSKSLSTTPGVYTQNSKVQKKDELKHQSKLTQNTKSDSSGTCGSNQHERATLDIDNQCFEFNSDHFHSDRIEQEGLVDNIAVDGMSNSGLDTECSDFIKTNLNSETVQHDLKSGFSSESENVRQVQTSEFKSKTISDTNQTDLWKENKVSKSGISDESLCENQADLSPQSHVSGSKQFIKTSRNSVATGNMNENGAESETVSNVKSSQQFQGSTSNHSKGNQENMNTSPVVNTSSVEGRQTSGTNHHSNQSDNLYFHSDHLTDSLNSGLKARAAARSKVRSKVECGGNLTQYLQNENRESGNCESDKNSSVSNLDNYDFKTVNSISEVTILSCDNSTKSDENLELNTEKNHLEIGISDVVSGVDILLDKPLITDQPKSRDERNLYTSDQNRHGIEIKYDKLDEIVNSSDKTLVQSEVSRSEQGREGLYQVPVESCTSRFNDLNCNIGTNTDNFQLGRLIIDSDNLSQNHTNNSIDISDSCYDKHTERLSVDLNTQPGAAHFENVVKLDTSLKSDWSVEDKTTSLTERNVDKKDNFFINTAIQTLQNTQGSFDEGRTTDSLCSTQINYSKSPNVYGIKNNLNLTLNDSLTKSESFEGSVSHSIGLVNSEVIGEKDSGDSSFKSCEDNKDGDYQVGNSSFESVESFKDCVQSLTTSRDQSAENFYDSFPEIEKNSHSEVEFSENCNENIYDSSNEVREQTVPEDKNIVLHDSSNLSDTKLHKHVENSGEKLSRHVDVKKSELCDLVSRENVQDDIRTAGTVSPDHVNFVTQTQNQHKVNCENNYSELTSVKLQEAETHKTLVPIFTPTNDINRHLDNHSLEIQDVIPDIPLLNCGNESQLSLAVDQNKVCESRALSVTDCKQTIHSENSNNDSNGHLTLISKYGASNNSLDRSFEDSEEISTSSEIDYFSNVCTSFSPTMTTNREDLNSQAREAAQSLIGSFLHTGTMCSSAKMVDQNTLHMLNGGESVFSDNSENSRSQLRCQNSESVSNINNSNNQMKSSISSAKEKFFQTEQSNNVDNGKTVSISKSKVQEKISKMDETTSMQPQTNNVFCVNSSKTSVNSSKTSEKISKLVVRDSKSILTVSYCDTHISSHIRDTVRVTQTPTEAIKNAEETKREILSQSSNSSRSHKETKTSSRFYIKDGQIVSPDGKFLPISADEVFGKLNTDVKFSDKNPSLHDKAECDLNTSDISNLTNMKNIDKLQNSSLIFGLQSPTNLSNSGENKKQVLPCNDEGISEETNFNDSVTSVKTVKEGQSLSDTNSNYSTIKITSGKSSPRATSNWNRVKAQLPKFESESSKMSNNRNGSTLNLNSPEVNERIVQLRQSAEKFAQARCSSPPLENRFRRVAKEVMVKSNLKKDMTQMSSTGNVNLHKTESNVVLETKSNTLKTKPSELLMPKAPSLVKSKSTGSDYKRVVQKQSDRNLLGKTSVCVRPKSPLACEVHNTFKSTTLPRTLINKSTSQIKTQPTVIVNQNMGPGRFPVNDKSCDNSTNLPSKSVETSVNPTMVLSDYDNLPKPVENGPIEVHVVSKSQIQSDSQGTNPETHPEEKVKQSDQDSKAEGIDQGNKSEGIDQDTKVEGIDQDSKSEVEETKPSTSASSKPSQEEIEIIKDFPSDISSPSEDSIGNDQLCSVELIITEEDLQSSESDSRNQSFENEPEESPIVTEEKITSMDQKLSVVRTPEIFSDKVTVVGKTLEFENREDKGIQEAEIQKKISADEIQVASSQNIIKASLDATKPPKIQSDNVNVQPKPKPEARDETPQSEDDPEIKVAIVKRFKATKALWKKTVNQVINSGKEPEVSESKVETVVATKSHASPGKDKVQSLRKNLSNKLTTPVSESPLTSPLANRKYQWVKGEGGIWKKEYLDVPREGSSSPSICGSPMRMRSVSPSPVKSWTPTTTTVDHKTVICDNLPTDPSSNNGTKQTCAPEIVLNTADSNLDISLNISDQEPFLKSETISDIPVNLPSREPVQSYQQKMVEFDKTVNKKPGEIFTHDSPQSLSADKNQINGKVENKNVDLKQKTEYLETNLDSNLIEEPETSDSVAKVDSDQNSTEKLEISGIKLPVSDVNQKVKGSVELKNDVDLLKPDITNKSASYHTQVEVINTGMKIISGENQTSFKIQDDIDNGVESQTNKKFILNSKEISPEKCVVADMQIPVHQESEESKEQCPDNNKMADPVTLKTDFNQIAEREKVASKQNEWQGTVEDILPSPIVYKSAGTNNNQITDDSKLLSPRKTHSESAIFMSKSPEKQLSSSLLCDLFSPPGVVVPRRLKKQGKSKNLKLLTEGAVRCPSLVLEESYSDEELLNKPDVNCSIVLETDFSSYKPIENVRGSPQRSLREADIKLLSEIVELEESSTQISSEKKVKGNNSDLTSSRRQKTRKSVRRSLSLPTCQLSYNDNVKITYIDGHFVTGDPETYSSEYNVSHSDNTHLVDNNSEIEASPLQSSVDINSMRDEILSLLNKRLSTSENAFWDQSYDWNFNHVPEDSDTKSGLISSTLPRRRIKDGPPTQRPLSVDEIKLWRHSSHSVNSQSSEENDPSESIHGDDISITSSKYDSQYSSQLSVDETGKRSKSPNFFKRMLSKRKSFSEKSAPKDEVFTTGSSASLTRRMSFRSFFKRKNSSSSRKDSDSEDPNSPPIVGFLTNEDIGAISVPNSPHIYKKPGQSSSEACHNHIEIIRHNSVPYDSHTLSHNSISHHTTSQTNQSDHRVGHQSSNQPPPRPSSAKPEISPRRKGSVCSLRQAMGVTYDRSSGEFSEVDYINDMLNSEGTLSPPSVSPNSSVMAFEGDVTLTDGDRTITGYLPCDTLSPGDVEKLLHGELTGSNSSDSGIQHDLHLQSTESLQKVLNEVGSIASAVRLRKSPSPARERPKSDTTYSVRFADLLEQVCEEDETYYTKDGKPIRRKPRPKSDIDDLIIFSRSLSDDDIADEEVFMEGGSSVYMSHMKAFGGSMGNLRPSDSLRSLVELRRQQQEYGTKTIKQVKNRRMSTPHPIKSRTNKKSTKSHNRHELVRSHSMPESLDLLHRRRNFLSLIGGDTSSIYSQSGGDCDSSDESEISVDFNHQDKSSRSNRGSQVTLATLEEFIEEENLIYAEALWDHVTMDTDEMGFRAGDLIRVTDLMDKDWWFGMIDDRQGWFPATFVRLRVNQAEVEEELTMLIQEETENVPKIRHHGVSYIDKNQARANVVNEIINAEREYSKHLKDVVEGYVKQARKRPEMFPEEKIETMFGNIEEIYSHASKFLCQLESKINSTSPHLSEIGSTFQDNSKRFEIYSDYCNNHPSACDELKDLYRNKRYRHFFEACRLLQDMIEIPLEGFLLTPVQKICKYHLQLAELLKYTPLDHPDHPHVKGALEAMKKIATLINERKRKMESIEKIATWQMSVDTWEGDDLLDVSSELIYSGELHKINSSGWSQERYFFLFDHQLVYCKKDILKKNSFCYKGRVNLDHCEIIPLEDGKDTQYNVTVRHAWKLHNTQKDKWYLMVAKSDSVKQRWLKAFQDERQRVKDDQENNFNIPEHIRQTAIHNVKQKTNLHRSKGKRKLAKRSASFKLPSNKDKFLSASAMATLPRTPRRQDSTLSNISQSKKLTWFFLSGKKTK